MYYYIQVKRFRLGQPAKVTESVQKYTLDVLFLERTKAIEALYQKLAEHRRNNNDDPELEEHIRKENVRLKADRRDYLKDADVVLGTFLTCSLLPRNHFQVTVIDECSQAKEASCWLVIPKSPKLILAGDYHQLPPVVHGRRTEELCVSLMERLLKQQKYRKDCSIMLTMQYRYFDMNIKFFMKQIYLKNE